MKTKVQTKTIETTPGNWLCVVTEADGTFNLETCTKAGPCKSSKEASDLMTFMQTTILRRK